MVRSRGSPRGGAKPSGPDGPSSWQPRVNQIRSAPLDAERRGWTRTFFDLKRQATPCGARCQGFDAEMAATRAYLHAGSARA